MDKLRQPPELDFTSSEGNLSERWKRWRQTMNLYMDVCMKDATQKEKCSAFLYVIGQDGRDIHNTFQFAEDEINKIDPLIQKFEAFCIPKQNTTMERYKFNKRAQGETESVNQYITELRLLAKNCRFGDLHDELIRDRIICGIKSDRLQARLLQEENLTLEKTVNLSKADEESQRQLKDLTKEKKVNIDWVEKDHKKRDFESKKPKYFPNKRKQSYLRNKECGKCGQSHPKRQCPAFGKTCHACKKPNHYERCCRSKKVHGLEESRVDHGQKSRSFESACRPCAVSPRNKKFNMAGFNMAGRKRHSSTVDYVQLNSLSSVVLYDTGGKRKTGRFYEAERVIQRRTVRHDHEYLIKWRGWPLEDCSWEPSENLSKDLLRSFVKPIQPSDEKLQNASCQFASGVLSALKSSSLSPVYVNIQLDVWRYITFKKGTPSEHRGHFMFTKNDFSRFKWLSDNWWYYLDQHGEGMAVDFPIKIKPVLSWSPAHFIKKAGKLCKAKKFPLEKLCLTIAKEPCTLKNMDVD